MSCICNNVNNNIEVDDLDESNWLAYVPNNADMVYSEIY